MSSFCPICRADEVEAAYVRHDGVEWPGCLNCEATAPPEVWADLVAKRDAFDAR